MSGIKGEDLTSKPKQKFGELRQKYDWKSAIDLSLEGPALLSFVNLS